VPALCLPRLGPAIHAPPAPHDPLDVRGRAARPTARSRASVSVSRRGLGHAPWRRTAPRGPGRGREVAVFLGRARTGPVHGPPQVKPHPPGEPGSTGAEAVFHPRARRTRGSARAGARWRRRDARTARRSRRRAGPALWRNAEGQGQVTTECAGESPPRTYERLYTWFCAFGKGQKRLISGRVMIFDLVVSDRRPASPCRAAGQALTEGCRALTSHPDKAVKRKAWNGDS